MNMCWNAIWEVLNKVAIIGTIIGIPATVYGIYKLIYGGIVLYDCYQEPNDAGGETLVIGEFSKRDYKEGKKENPNRQYHKKGLRHDNENNWV